MAILAVAGRAATGQPLLIRHPTISAGKIAFCYAGISGPRPVMAAAPSGSLLAPASSAASTFSADGKWMAFTADYQGLVHPPLAFALRQEEHLHMTPRAQKIKPTAGAIRASDAIQRDAALLKSLPELIDRETGVREILDILQSIISQAGDLIETRSPELVAAARAALIRYNDDARGEAE
jgi:hypothetical protein